jgi:hypothetical protein
MPYLVDQGRDTRVLLRRSATVVNEAGFTPSTRLGG